MQKCQELMAAQKEIMRLIHALLNAKGADSTK
jgi:hypothetical protein